MKTRNLPKTGPCCTRSLVDLGLSDRTASKSVGAIYMLRGDVSFNRWYEVHEYIYSMTRIFIANLELKLTED